jgi:hypothetical protein
VKKDSLDYYITRDSIKRDGVLVPLLVRPRSDGLFEVVDGATRHESLLDLRVTDVECNIRDMTDQEVEAFQVTLNWNTAKTVDLARRLIKIVRRDESMTINSLAHRVKIHPDGVARVLGLRRLCPAARREIERDSLPAAVLIELAKLPHGVQEPLLESHDSMPFDAFVDTIQSQVRHLRAGNRDSRSSNNRDRSYRYRNLKESVNEYLLPTVAASVLCSVEAKTALDGWKACHAWHLQDDLASRAKNQQSQTPEFQNE